jgi:hypothetical protein
MYLTRLITNFLIKTVPCLISSLLWHLMTGLIFSVSKYRKQHCATYRPCIFFYLAKLSIQSGLKLCRLWAPPSLLRVCADCVQGLLRRRQWHSIAHFFWAMNFAFADKRWYALCKKMQTIMSWKHLINRLFQADTLFWKTHCLVNTELAYADM